MTCWLSIRDIDGTTVRLLLDEAAGYIIEPPVRLADESWRRTVVTSEFVHGDDEVHAVLDAGVLEVMIRVTGSSWVQVEQRRLAMRDALRDGVQWACVLHVDGVTTTWRANRPDLSSSITGGDVIVKWRRVLLRIPVQPNETVTGV